MKLEEYISKIEEVEGSRIEDIIYSTYNRLNKTAFLVKDEFKEMLGVFYLPFINYGVNKDLIHESMVKDDTIPNYIENNQLAVESGLDTKSDYEMLILGLYYSLVEDNIDAVNEIFVNGNFYKYNEI